MHGSRELIGQTLANLVDNALKYGVQPGPGGSIVVSGVRRGGMIEIGVADHGPGLSASDRSRITERFVRLENSRSQPGTGLGLSLVEAVVRLHKGELRIEDNEPGLKVIVRLPAIRPALLAPIVARDAHDVVEREPLPTAP